MVGGTISTCPETPGPTSQRRRRNILRTRVKDLIKYYTAASADPSEFSLPAPGGQTPG